jgi:DNA-binding NarL/FixJ family response regulator
MITTLLVDDNETFVTLAVRMLAENFASDIVVVGTAFDGEQGLLKAAALRPRLVLMDLIMPGLSGLQVIPALREHSPQSYIIALSVLSSDGYRQAALDAGADAFMIKSQLGAALPAILRSLNGSSPALTAAGDLPESIGAYLRY